MLDLSIYYRGPLSSCNYACGYCPFAKRRNTAAELADDAHKLARFVAWIEARPNDRFGVMFTPWGEALIRKPYREAMVRLSRLPQVRRVAAQTNLSYDVGWVAAADRERLALWCTYHPGEVSQDAFVARCERLHALGVRMSVGVVGLREHVPAIEALRGALPPDVYVWVNAYKREPGYYDVPTITRIERIDPLFALNNTRHESLGRACSAGQRSILVDGDGPGATLPLRGRADRPALRRRLRAGPAGAPLPQS